jgi:hypothetical protein
MTKILIIKRDWPESNWRPSASDWCEFPHSLDYSFTMGKIPVGGGRMFLGKIPKKPVSAPSPILTDESLAQDYRISITSSY